MICFGLFSFISFYFDLIFYVTAKQFLCRFTNKYKINVLKIIYMNTKFSTRNQKKFLKSRGKFTLICNKFITNS